MRAVTVKSWPENQLPRLMNICYDTIDIMLNQRESGNFYIDGQVSGKYSYVDVNTHPDGWIYLELFNDIVSEAGLIGKMLRAEIACYSAKDMSKDWLKSSGSNYAILAKIGRDAVSLNTANVTVSLSLGQCVILDTEVEHELSFADDDGFFYCLVALVSKE